jgi:mono/diheme cytochrome c family protein
MLLALSACDAPQVGAPPQLDAPAARARGRELFLAHCAICHGERADGRGRRRAALSTAPANFRDPSWASRTTPERTWRIIRTGVAGTPMPAWQATLGEGQTWDLVAYLLGVGSERAEGTR